MCAPWTLGSRRRPPPCDRGRAERRCRGPRSRDRWPGGAWVPRGAAVPREASRDRWPGDGFDRAVARVRAKRHSDYDPFAVSVRTISPGSHEASCGGDRQGRPSTAPRPRPPVDRAAAIRSLRPGPRRRHPVASARPTPRSDASQGQHRREDAQHHQQGGRPWRRSPAAGGRARPRAPLPVAVAGRHAGPRAPLAAPGASEGGDLRPRDRAGERQRPSRRRSASPSSIALRTCSGRAILSVAIGSFSCDVGFLLQRPRG